MAKNKTHEHPPAPQRAANPWAVSMRIATEIGKIWFREVEAGSNLTLVFHGLVMALRAIIDSCFSNEPRLVALNDALKAVAGTVDGHGAR